jgi:hypothetical protein
VADDDDAWPDVIEEAAVHDSRDPDARQLNNYSQAAGSVDPEDSSYLMIMQLLQHLDGELPVFLTLSDRVTSHTVHATGFFIEDRTYRITYSDPWGYQSFLEYGKNVAGVAAKRYGEYEWSVSHHELSRVLDSYIAPLGEAEDGERPQN